MRTKNRTKTFSVSADVRLWTSINVEANTLEDALQKARDLKVTDFIDIPGEHNDSQLEIVGVSDNALPAF